MSFERESYGRETSGVNPLLTPGSVLDLNKGVVDDIDEKELGVENDKANDKLVDLVSLLTNKINKNVKEIQVDIIDHYESTNKKFDDLETKGFDRVRDLTQKVEERKEANRVLKLKIIELQKKQKGILEKYDKLDGDITQFKDHHEEVTGSMENNLKKHGIMLKEFEDKETLIKQDFDLKFTEMTKDMEIKVSDIKQEIDQNKTAILLQIKNNASSLLSKHETNIADITKINKRLEGHEEDHKKKREEIIKTSKIIDELIDTSEEKFREQEKNQMTNDNTHMSLKDLVTNHYEHCQEIVKNFKQKIVYIENEIKENTLIHSSFSQQIRETDTKLRKYIEETENKLEEIKKSIILFEKSHYKLANIVTESNENNRKALESQTAKVSDINKEINALGKEIFEIKITVNENKESDDKNQGAVNKKLNDIFEKKGNVNEQLNNLMYLLTNSEVAIEENNRNTLNQLSKFKKFQSQISEDFTKQFSVLEKLLDAFTTETKKNIVEEKRSLDTSCRENSDNFKGELNSLTSSINAIKTSLNENLKSLKTDFQDFQTSGKRQLEENISQLHDTIHRLGSKEVSPAVQESKDFKQKIKELERRIRDMTNIIEEFPREWSHSLLFHGIPVQDKENFYSKAKVVSEIIRKSLGIRREVMITGMTRLIPTENEVGGWPPMSVSFQYPEDRDEVLGKAGAVKGTNIKVTKRLYKGRNH